LGSIVSASCQNQNKLPVSLTDGRESNPLFSQSATLFFSLILYFLLTAGVDAEAGEGQTNNRRNGTAEAGS
jgi:hypothetical protein